MFFLYLDPGSGSILLQLIIAAVAGLGLFFGSQWKKIRKIFNRNKPVTDEKKDLDADEE